MQKMFISKANQAIFEINKRFDKMACEKLDANYFLKKELKNNNDKDSNKNSQVQTKSHSENVNIVPIKSDLLQPVAFEVNSKRFKFVSKEKNKEFGKDILQSFKYHFAFKLMRNFRIYVFKRKLTKLYGKIIVYSLCK